MASISGAHMNDRQEKILAWFAALCSCLYYLWAYASLHHFAKSLDGVFQGLGVDLPYPTRLVIQNQLWLFPLLFVGASVWVVLKEFMMVNKRLSLSLTLATAVLVVFTVDWIKSVFFLPLLEMMDKLK